MHNNADNADIEALHQKNGESFEYRQFTDSKRQEVGKQGWKLLDSIARYTPTAEPFKASMPLKEASQSMLDGQQNAAQKPHLLVEQQAAQTIENKRSIASYSYNHQHVENAGDGSVGAANSPEDSKFSHLFAAYGGQTSEAEDEKKTSLKNMLRQINSCR